MDSPVPTIQTVSRSAALLTFLVIRQFLASGSFEAPRGLAEAAALVKEHGYKGLYILTCADGRVLPEEIFGLKKGEANILRNAGGRAIESDVFRTLGVMSTIAPVGTLIVLHHTGKTFTFIYRTSH